MKKLLVIFFAASLALAVEARHDEEMPILAWYSIVGKDNATLERYRELRECGFNYTFSITYSLDDAMQALDLAAKTGMKSIFTCSQLQSEPEKTARLVHKHRGLGGYFLRDEPQTQDFEALAEWARSIERVDTKHPCYLNLLPIVWAEEVYREHLREFNRVVNLPQVSFDHYPIHQQADGSITLNGNYYQNLELVSEACREAGKPFWAFALSTAHATYPVPTMEHLRLQMYSNLAYGAQALQYFTYWSPGTETWDFHDAPITHEGKRSRVYDLVRELNQEIQRRAFVFLGAKVQNVRHTGDCIPLATQRLTQLPKHFRTIDTHGAPALVSILQKASTTYVVIQNTSPTKNLSLCIETDDTPLRIRRDGTSVPASLYAPDYVITPGDVEIFSFEE